MGHLLKTPAGWVALVITLLLMPVAYWIADTEAPYEYNVEESFVVPNPAYDGDQITVNWKLKKINRICFGIKRRELFDPRTKVILALYDAIPPERSNSIKDGYLNVTFLLPRRIQTGLIGYRARVDYQCNFLQKLLPQFFAIPTVTPDLFFVIERAAGEK